MTIVQPAHCTPSRYARYGSGSLKSQETGSLAHRPLSNSVPPRFCFCSRCRVDNSLQQPRVRLQFFVLIIFLRLLIFRLWFFLLAFHLILFLVRATIRVLVLVFCSNVPVVGLARLVFVHGLQSCRVFDFCFFSTSLVLCRYLSYSRPRNCRFPPPAVFRSSLPVFITGRNAVVT